MGDPCTVDEGVEGLSCHHVVEVSVGVACAGIGTQEFLEIRLNEGDGGVGLIYLLFHLVDGLLGFAGISTGDCDVSGSFEG